MSTDVDIRQPTQVRLASVELHNWPISKDEEGQAEENGVVVEASPFRENAAFPKIRFRVAPSESQGPDEVYRVLTHIQKGPDPTVWIKQIGKDREGLPVCLVADHDVWAEDEALVKFFHSQVRKTQVARVMGLVVGLGIGFLFGVQAGRRWS